MQAPRPLQIFAAILCGLLLASHAAAAPSVVVGWDPNPAGENVTGYVLYWSSVSRHASEFTGFDHQQDVGNTTEWTIDLPAGTARCFFSVTAYNAEGLVSDYSTELGTVIVTPTSTAGGSISPAAPVVVEAGGSLDLAFTPDTGYEVEDIEIDGVSFGAMASYTLAPVDAPHTVLARFAPVQSGPTQYNVQLFSGAHGQVLPSGTIAVNEGASLTFTVTPEFGYEVAAVWVDDVDVGPVAAYTLSSVYSDVTVAATFQTVAIDPNDSDNDQIPDVWELHYFSGLDTDPDADSDGDGRSNYQEYLANTDPTVAELEPALTPPTASPISGATVVNHSVELVVENPINDAALALTYQFEISVQPDLGIVLASSGDVAEGASGITSWSVPVSLDDETRYYWRARAVGDSVASEWTPANTFYRDSRGAPTTVELLAAEFVPATTDTSLDILDPTSPANGLGVDVPAATLPYDFILTVSAVNNPPQATRTARLAGQTVELGPHGRPFSTEVTILLPYSDQTLAEAGIDSAGELDVLTYNTSTLRWEAVPDVVTDYAGHRLIARVSHFSMYSLGVGPEQTPAAQAASGGGGGGGGCFIRSLW